MSHHPPPMNLLTLKQVAAKLSVSPSYVCAIEKRDPTFPRSLRLGGPEVPLRARVTRWVEADVEKWLTNKQEVHNDSNGNEDGRSGPDVHQNSGEEVPA